MQIKKYLKPQVISLKKEDILPITGCQYTGSLTITFRQTAQLTKQPQQTEVFFGGDSLKQQEIIRIV